MLRNYVNTALRHLLKYKTYSAINILGLAAGIAAVILILLYVEFELSYDGFHENCESIHRVSIVTKREGRIESDSPVFVDPLGPAMEKDFPAVKASVRISTRRSAYFHYNDTIVKIPNFRHADSSLFDVFSFTLTQGNPQQALINPYSIVLTEGIAHSFFGTENPIGKTIVLNNREAYHVTGVVENTPSNSTLNFDALVSFSTLYNDPDYYMGWNGGNQYMTYIQLKENASPEDVEATFPDFMWTYINEDVAGIGISYEPYLQPLKKIHLWHESAHGPLMLFVYGGIALLILILAGINSINLTISLSSSRAREIGVRKVLGADRMSLIGQFMAESILTGCLALAVAMVLTQLILPVYKDIIGYNMESFGLISAAHLLWLPIFILLVGFGAGSYPALHLSSLESARTLKGVFQSGWHKRRFRSALVIFQFTAAVILMICTLVIQNQIRYMKKKHLGFNKENIIVLPLTTDELQSRSAILKEELSYLPDVIVVARSSQIPYRGFTRNGYFPEGYESPYYFHVVDVDETFLETYDIALAAGRNFSHERSTDEHAYLINATLAKTLSWDNPLRKIIRRNGDHAVIGVVKDFHYSTLHERIEPLILTNRPWDDKYNYVSIRVRSADVAETIASVQQTFTNMFPEVPFEYWFLDEAFDMLYRSEERFQLILFCFTSLALIIALLGLLSLASLSIEQRTKEIGVRKVLGATVEDLIVSLSRGFMKLVFISIVIASPIAWFIVNTWLQHFSYRTEVTPWTFVVVGLVALGIALLAVSYRSLRAALANPVESLRYE